MLNSMVETRRMYNIEHNYDKLQVMIVSNKNCPLRIKVGNRKIEHLFILNYFEVFLNYA